ncbi:Response regulator (modular protein) [Verrucomicrobia bacterium]|nr:Response regulator (modular protein) [Verrucomicrobiota bacterium]
MKTLRILHVEDDPDDAFFLRKALIKAEPNCEIQRVCDGEEAIEYLRGLCQPAAALSHQLWPDMIVLDLKLPKISGLEVLAWLHSQEHLSGTPVIALSGSSLGADRHQALELGAIAYVVKSSVYTETAAQLLRLASAKMTSVLRADAA